MRPLNPDLFIAQLYYFEMRNADARFDAEEVIVSGNRATVLSVYRKMRNGQPWHLRGVDIFSVREKRIAAKLAYVKGCEADLIAPCQRVLSEWTDRLTTSPTTTLAIYGN